jgi:anti-anti-sigma factor
VTVPLASLETSRRDGHVLIGVTGEIDLSNAFRLGREMEDAAVGAESVSIDLTPVRYIDSRGVRVLYQLCQRLTAEGIELSFVAPADSIAGQVLTLTRLTDLVPVLDSRS